MPLGVLLVDCSAEFFQFARRRAFAEQLAEHDRGEQTIGLFVQVMAIHRQRLGLFRVKVLRRLVEIHEQDVVGARDFGHHGGIILQPGIVRSRVRRIQIAVLFICGGREQHDARRATAGIIFCRRVLQEFIEVSAKFFQALVAFEGFIVAEESEHNVSLDLFQPVVRRAEILGAVSCGYLVTGDGEVAHDQIMLREFGVDECLEIAEVLHAIRQGVANDRDVIALF